MFPWDICSLTGLLNTAIGKCFIWVCHCDDNWKNFIPVHSTLSTSTEIETRHVNRKWSKHYGSLTSLKRWKHKHYFLPFSKGWQLSRLPVCLSEWQSPSKTLSTVKGMNLQILSIWSCSYWEWRQNWQDLSANRIACLTVLCPSLKNL